MATSYEQIKSDIAATHRKGLLPTGIFLLFCAVTGFSGVAETYGYLTAISISGVFALFGLGCIATRFATQIEKFNASTEDRMGKGARFQDRVTQVSNHR